MILVIILLILFTGAVLSLITSKLNGRMPRLIALNTIAIEILLMLIIWYNSSHALSINKTVWLYSCNLQWIPSLSVNFQLAMDGISLIMVFLTLIMAFIAILVSPPTYNEGFYYFNTLLMVTGVTGIFLAFDMFLFFFFWEMMLVPLYLLMVMFSKETGLKIPYKFLLYTQTSGLILLLSILAISFIYRKETGIHTYNYFELIAFSAGIKTALLIMPGFLIAFLVKLPAVPFHGWFGGSFTSSPITAIIIGLLIKTGAYGIIRFIVPLFHFASVYFTSAAMVLGVITIIYGAFMAFSQDDLRLIAAFSSLSHMGFILIGIFAFNVISWQGVILQMISSSVGASALIIIAFSLIKRTGNL